MLNTQTYIVSKLHATIFLARGPSLFPPWALSIICYLKINLLRYYIYDTLAQFEILNLGVRMEMMDHR